MPRYIDADKLQEEFKELHGGKRSLLIDIAPTAEVVEIVRCKDCRWYEINELKSDGTEDKRYKPSVCVLHSRSFKDNYYCADGDRA